jgi:predicted MFS family arabinose efflux permease
MYRSPSFDARRPQTQYAFLHGLPAVAYVDSAAMCTVGVGEGVVLPSMNSLVATHVSPAAKSRALGFIFTGFHSGNLVGLTLSPAIISAYGWQAIFLVVGCLGVPLLLLWRFLQPAAPPGTVAHSGKAPAKSKQVPLKDFLTNRAVQAIIVANFVNHWGYFIFLSWIPSFFATVYGLNMRASSFMAFVPWIAMAVGATLAGILADHLVATYPARAPCLPLCHAHSFLHT